MSATCGRGLRTVQRLLPPLSYLLFILIGGYLLMTKPKLSQLAQLLDKLEANSVAGEMGL